MGFLDHSIFTNPSKQRVLGVVCAIVLPVISFFIITSVMYTEYQVSDIVRLSKQFGFLSKILVLTLLPNLFLFYFFLQKELDKAAYAMVVLTLLFTVSAIMFTM